MKTSRKEQLQWQEGDTASWEFKEVILNENETYECNVRVKERQTEKTNEYGVWSLGNWKVV